MKDINDISGTTDWIDLATDGDYLHSKSTAYAICDGDIVRIDNSELMKTAIVDQYIYNNKKEKEYETELQGKNTPVTRGTGNKECRIRSRRNKTRVTLGHLGYKTIS